MPGCLSSEKHEQDHLFYKNLRLSLTIAYIWPISGQNIGVSHVVKLDKLKQTIPNNTQQTHKFDY